MRLFHGNNYMKIQKYTIKEINWAKHLFFHQNMDQRLADSLPKHGFMVFDSGVPVAMGFIRRLEGNLGVLDSYITNPNFTPGGRNRALDLLTKKLIRFGKDKLKLKGLLAFSADTNTIQRATNHGFWAHPDNVFQSLYF